MWTLLPRVVIALLACASPDPVFPYVYTPEADLEDYEQVRLSYLVGNDHAATFYERHGFRVVAHGTVRSLDVTTWSMLREPA